MKDAFTGFKHVLVFPHSAVLRISLFSPRKGHRYQLGRDYRGTNNGMVDSISLTFSAVVSQKNLLFSPRNTSQGGSIWRRLNIVVRKPPATFLFSVHPAIRFSIGIALFPSSTTLFSDLSIQIGMNLTEITPRLMWLVTQGAQPPLCHPEGYAGVSSHYQRQIMELLNLDKIFRRATKVHWRDCRKERFGSGIGSERERMFSSRDAVPSSSHFAPVSPLVLE